MFDTEKFKFSPLFANSLVMIWAFKNFHPPLVLLPKPYAAFSLPVFFADEGTKTQRKDLIRHGLSGFGRRNSLLLIYVAAVVQANQAHFKSKGLKLHFSIYEMQKEAEAGSGNSCQTTCDGALNTGIPDKLTIPGAAAGVQSPIADLTNLAQFIKDDLERDIPKHKKVLQAENLAALELFVEAIHEKKIDATEAFTTRGAIGRIQQPEIEKVLTYIKEHMSDMITIDRFFEQEVVGLVVTNPQKPKLKVKKVGTTNVQVTDEFDFVHLANGTPWAFPPGVTPGPTVSSAIPNQDEVKKFLTENKLLENGLIKNGAHIGITGLSLSAYDYVPLVLRYTSVIEPTETGYKINLENAVHYQGLLTFISRTGVPTPPRIDAKHSANHPSDILGTSEELHALQLQKQFDWLTFWTVFLDANVARFLGKLPKDLHYRKLMDPKARMEDYARQTEAHRRGEQTEVGLQRTGNRLAYGGQGFYVDPAEAEKAEIALVGKAPLTRKERAGFLLRRGSLAEVTSTAYVDVHSNKAFFDAYTTMHSLVAASPPAIHYLVARMFELGVATHAAGDFAEIVPSLHSNVLLAPNQLDRRNDVVLVSLGDTVKNVVPGQPEYAKGRFLRTPGGALVHAIDTGMGGQGTRVSHSDDHESIVGMRWSDTSFLDAAAYGAASLAPMTVLLSSIAAEGDNKPAERLLEYYKAGLPKKEEFNAETAKFNSVWKEVQEKHAFLVLCEEAAGNALQYLEYTDKVFASDSRETLVGGWEKARQHVAATDKYRKTVEHIPAFNPPSVEEYFERFVDLSPSEVQKCWDAHMKA